MHHASYPVFVHRPAALDWASSRPRLAATPLPFSLPSALRKPGHRTFTYEVTRHARRTRPRSAAAGGARLRRVVMRGVEAPLREHQIGHPTKPPNNCVSDGEIRSGNYGCGDVKPQHYGSKLKRKVAHHPFPVLINRSTTNGEESPQSGIQPTDCKCGKAKLGGRTAKSELGYVKSGKTTDENTHAQVHAPHPPGELNSSAS